MKAAKSDVKIGDVVVLKICASTSAVAASEIARKSSNVRYHTCLDEIFGSISKPYNNLPIWNWALELKKYIHMICRHRPIDQTFCFMSKILKKLWYRNFRTVTYWRMFLSSGSSLIDIGGIFVHHDYFFFENIHGCSCSEFAIFGNTSPDIEAN